MAGPAFGFLVNNRWQFSDDLTWVKGRHTLKSGFEFRYHDFPFRGWAVGSVAGEFHFNRLGTAGFDASGNNLAPTGDPFASFLLGQVQTANQTIPVEPTFRETYTGAWINDEFKVSDKLTLTLGLRFDYQSARTEVNDQYSTFDPNTPNPGAGNLPGAMIFAGDGPGRAGTRTFEDPPKDAWGPRIGAAYRVNDRSALRGGYGIYYAHVAFDQFVGQPTLGFQANALAANTTNGIQPAFLLDQGFPASAIQQPPFIDPDVRPGDGAHRGGERWTDAAAVPELVDHLRARIDQQHDGGRVVHRQPRQPSEPSLADTGRRREHELAQRAVAGNAGPAVEHQLGSGAPGRHSVAISGLQRQRGAGAPKVSAVPEHHLARRADR